MSIDTRSKQSTLIMKEIEIKQRSLISKLLFGQLSFGELSYYRLNNMARLIKYVKKF